MEKSGRVKVSTLFYTSQGLFSARDVERDLTLAADPHLRPVGLVAVKRRIFSDKPVSAIVFGNGSGRSITIQK